MKKHEAELLGCTTPICAYGPAVLLLGNCIFLRHDQQPALDLLHITALSKHNLVYEKHHIGLSSWPPSKLWIYQRQRIRHREGTKSPLEAVFCSHQSDPNKAVSYPSELKHFGTDRKPPKLFWMQKLYFPWVSSIQTIWTLPQDWC